MVWGEDGKSETADAIFLSPEKKLELLEGGVVWDHMGPTCWVFGTIV